MPWEIPKTEFRTIGQIREHYEIEKRLADSLRTATKQERLALYRTVYDELCRLVPHHPNLTQKTDQFSRAKAISKILLLLERFLKPDITFLEVGPGDCRLSFEVAKKVKKVYGVDVCSELTKSSVYPENFELIISDGCAIPVPENSVDIIFSNQLMEHLHPEDVLEQLQNIYRVLKRGGMYLCITPNRLNGPHDISRYFDEIATGFHLKEYTNTELAMLFKSAGFATVKVLMGAKGVFMVVPIGFDIFIENILSKLSRPAQRTLAVWSPISLLLGIRLLAQK